VVPGEKVPSARISGCRSGVPRADRTAATAGVGNRGRFTTHRSSGWVHSSTEPAAVNK
jgi:hypothetical protein